jgi:hypothetical protein
MLARLGNVLYWTCCIIAVAIIAVPFLAWWSNPLPLRLWWDASNFVPTLVFDVAALIVYLMGRACRYVLADR